MVPLQLRPDTATSDFLSELERSIAERFRDHPFDGGVTRKNFESVIAEYLAMSISFPYIQAGAIHANYERVRQVIGDTNENVEVAGVVGSFLVWDEFGGYALAQKNGNEALCFLPYTEKHFHSNLLRKDVEAIIGRKIKPHWSVLTTRYLNELLAGLSDHQNNRNIAYMVAFESHANVMIQSLWNAISRVYHLPQDATLSYFYEHVGGESPAEAFHVEMTKRMIEHVVPPNTYTEFMAAYIEAYGASIDWCESLIS